MSAMFRSLAVRNYRVWFAGSLASNVGTWMQRTAQSWIVLTELTDNDATALGIVTGLQFAPQLILAPYAGVIADRYSKRRVLAVTQTVMGLLALGLGLIVVFGIAELWHVYLFAILLGIAASFDAPARQSFVSELVEPEQLSNAVALNSTSFNGARLVGPAVAGLLTIWVGSGLVFVLNALTFAATLWALGAMRRDELHPAPRAAAGRGRIREGLRYVAARPDLIAIMASMFVYSMIGMNFPVFVATMSTIEFGLGADAFGLLNSVLAIGSLTGALLAARRDRARFRVLIASYVFFGVTATLAALAPNAWSFAMALVAVGFTSLTALTTANALVQTSTEPAMRGRVLSLYLAILLGGTPIGSPLMGWLVELTSPRVALGIGAASGVLAALIAIGLLRRAGAVRWRDFPWMDPPWRRHSRDDIPPDPRTEEIQL